MKIYLNLFTPLIPFILGIILKTILDLNSGIWLIKKFHWIPLRNIFRIKAPKINGEWIQIWDVNDTSKYKAIESRSSLINIKQLGKFIYGEFRANNDEEYIIFGEIINNNIIGKWFDKHHELGYYGAFELKILDKNNIKGVWLGHSSHDQNVINSNKWTWTKKTK